MNSSHRENGGNSKNSIVLMLLSPAKMLDFSKMEEEVKEWTWPNCDPERTRTIVTAMKKIKPSVLSTVMKVSSSLAKQTADQWQNFRLTDNDEAARALDHSPSNKEDTSTPNTGDVQRKPCIYAYTGAAYQGLDIHTACDYGSNGGGGGGASDTRTDGEEDVLDYLQHNLRILDALYGVLRPWDQIQPYRLELITKAVVFSSDNSTITQEKQMVKLVDYWSNVVTQSLVSDMQKRVEVVAPLAQTAREEEDIASSAICVYLLNLASDEYSALIDTSLFPPYCRYIKVVFRNASTGRNVSSFHAKTARGLMVRYLAMHRITTLEGVRGFNLEGYRHVPMFEEEEEDKIDVLVFEQLQPAAKTLPSKSKSNPDTSVPTRSKRTKR